MPQTKSAKKSARSTGFTAAEKAAMRERARELKAAERWEKDKAAGESDVLAKIAEMAPSDRALAKRFHAIVTATAPDLSPRTWYGMPAYAKDGKIVCYFREARKFKDRYAMFGFNDKANLDDGAMWPIAFALKEMTGAEEKKIAALVRKAVS